MPKTESESRQGRQLLAKGLARRKTIVEAAQFVFKTRGYYRSSVSEITRVCGVSMATFYQYFENKEQLLFELYDQVVSDFKQKTAELAVDNGDFSARLRAIIRLLYDHNQQYLDFHRILSESELIDLMTVRYYDTIARFYRRFLRDAALAGHIRPLDPNIVAYGLIGICFFNALDWGPDDNGLPPDMVIDQIAELIMCGISGPRPWRRPSDWRLATLPDPLPLRNEALEPLTKGEKTRQIILQAADKVFGQLGVNRAGISDITREAGVAQGTFYIHFESKRELIEGFVKYMSHKMRREMHRFTAGARDRRDAELFGMLAFYRFVKQYREIYRVVPEFEIIGEKGELWYYKKLAERYIWGIRRGIEKGELKPLTPTVLVRALMGVTRSIGLKWIIWSPNPQAEIPHDLFHDIVEFVFFGLRPNPTLDS